MPVTSNFDLPWFEVTVDPPNGADQQRQLAEKIDSEFATIPGSIANLLARVTALEEEPQSGQVIYHGRRANAQQIANVANNDIATKIAWDASVYDPLNSRLAVPNNSRILPPVAGWYKLEGRGCTAAASSPADTNRVRDCGFKLNNVVIVGSAGRAQVVATGGGASAVGITVEANPVVVQLNGTTDYIEMWVKQESGGILNTLVDNEYVPTITVTYVGP